MPRNVIATDLPLRPGPPRPPTARPPGGPWAVPELAAHLGVSERHLWRLIAAGRVRTIKIGARTLIADPEARRLMTEGTK